MRAARDLPEGDRALGADSAEEAAFVIDLGIHRKGTINGSSGCLSFENRRRGSGYMGGDLGSDRVLWTGSLGAPVKVCILAGGVGSRLMEETATRPKPMVEVGGKPILWHIMKHYAQYGYDEFVIALGYQGEYIKRWFRDFAELTSDLTVKTGSGEFRSASGNGDDWTVHLVDTGQGTGTGGRIKRLQRVVGDERFLLTWGDGVSDIDLRALVAFHEGHGRHVTLTAVRPPARFGHLELQDDQIVEFSEKPQVGEGWINGAFFVCEPEVFDYIPGDETMFEQVPLERLAKDGQLMAYRHHGFWQCMDTLRDRVLLDGLWDAGGAPWKSWS